MEGHNLSKEKQNEVIKPGDRLYRNDDYFNNQNGHYQSRGYIKTFNCGCGPIGCGCFTLIFLLFLISSLVSYILNWIF